MSLSSRAQAFHDHVALHVEGDYSSDSLSELGDIVAKASEQHNRTRILLDMRQVPGLIANMESFVAGVYTAQIWPRPLRVAIVFQPQQIDQFFQNTAHNQGVQTLAVASEDEARAWLGV